MHGLEHVDGLQPRPLRDPLRPPEAGDPGPVGGQAVAPLEEVLLLAVQLLLALDYPLLQPRDLRPSLSKLALQLGPDAKGLGLGLQPDRLAVRLNRRAGGDQLILAAPSLTGRH